MPEKMPDRMSDRCQIECQNRCQEECQNRYQEECRIECQSICQKEYQIECQNVCICIQCIHTIICHKYLQMECQKTMSEYSVGVGIGRNLRQHSESVQPLWFAQIAQASRAETLERVPGESHHHRRIPALFLYGQSANPLTILS